MKRILFLLFLFALLQVKAQQKLQPGYDGKEYRELLSLAFHSNSIADSTERKTKKDIYERVYRSPEVGLLNRWTLYLRNDNVGAIDLRGTVNEMASWLENFYAAMIPATGSIQINDSTVFTYQLAADPKANVHVGWVIGIAHLAPDVENKINEYYKTKNVKEFLLFGHSQGGALAFLMRSYLEYEKQKGKIPADVVIKTYCSAAPKPGNIYYAYDFDFITRNGWASNTVNALDWVPETPFSIQTIDGFNETNPFANIKPIIKKQKFIARIAMNTVYKKLDKTPKKAQRKFEKYLGTMMYKQVKKYLPQLKQPAYVNDNNYMRAGVPVVLMPDEMYKTKFPDSKEKVFIHHMFEPYYYLSLKYYP